MEAPHCSAQLVHFSMAFRVKKEKIKIKIKKNKQQKKPNQTFFTVVPEYCTFLCLENKGIAKVTK